MFIVFFGTSRRMTIWYLEVYLQLLLKFFYIFLIAFYSTLNRPNIFNCYNVIKYFKN
jgi:hypothetical protein